MNQTELRSYCQEHYREVADLAMLAGITMAKHGAEAYRIEDTAVRLLKTTGFAYTEVYISVTGLMITLDDPSMDQPLSMTKRITGRNNDLACIARANDISRRFVAGDLTAPEAMSALEELSTLKNYSNPMIILGYALTAGLFTFMFGGYPLDALCAAVIGMVTGLIALPLEKVEIPDFIKTFVSSVVIGVVVVFFLSLLNLPLHAGPLVSGSVMPLVPGMLLTIAIRDLLTGDYLSGMSRAIEAGLTAIAIAAGVAIVMFVAESFLGTYDLSVPAVWFLKGVWMDIPFYLLQLLSAFVSAVAFVTLFNIDKRHLLWCGITATCTWMIYVLCTFADLGIAVANFLAALMASILAFWFAKKIKTPVTVFFTGGILCLVPGAIIYRSMFYFLRNDVGMGAHEFLTTLQVSGLIALAMLTQTTFVQITRHLRKRKKKQ